MRGRALPMFAKTPIDQFSNLETLTHVIMHLINLLHQNMNRQILRENARALRKNSTLEVVYQRQTALF